MRQLSPLKTEKIGGLSGNIFVAAKANRKNFEGREECKIDLLGISSDLRCD
jgi:hypothetical protein